MQAVEATEGTETATPVVVLVAEFYALGALLQTLERMMETQGDTR